MKVTNLDESLSQPVSSMLARPASGILTKTTKVYDFRHSVPLAVYLLLRAAVSVLRRFVVDSHVF